jgi:hypothetical protein
VKIVELVAEYEAANAVGLMLSTEELTAIALRATRYYAGYGDIVSLTLTENQPDAGELPTDPPAEVLEPYPIRDAETITDQTELTTGEWSVVSPLFHLYVEERNAVRLEASRAAGIEVFGRSVSEVRQDITMMEGETLPAKAFSSVAVTIS